MVPHPFFEAEPICRSSGIDCSTILHAKSTSCSQSLCVVHSCKNGWIPSSQVDECIPFTYGIQSCECKSGPALLSPMSLPTSTLVLTSSRKSLPLSIWFSNYHLLRLCLLPPNQRPEHLQAKLQHLSARSRTVHSTFSASLPFHHWFEHLQITSLHFNQLWMRSRLWNQRTGAGIKSTHRRWFVDAELVQQQPDCF